MTITFQPHPTGDGLAVRRDGVLVGTVLPTGTGRFQFFDTDGRYVTEVGSPTSIVVLVQDRAEQGLT